VRRFELQSEMYILEQLDTGAYKLLRREERKGTQSSGNPTSLYMLS